MPVVVWFSTMSNSQTVLALYCCCYCCDLAFFFKTHNQCISMNLNLLRSCFFSLWSPMLIFYIFTHITELQTGLRYWPAKQIFFCILFICKKKMNWTFQKYQKSSYTSFNLLSTVCRNYDEIFWDVSWLTHRSLLHKSPFFSLFISRWYL